MRLKTIGPSSSSSTTFGAKNHRYAPKETVRIHPWAVVMSGLIITPLQPVLLPSSIAGHPSDDQHYDSTSITTQNPADVVVSFNRNFAEFWSSCVFCVVALARNFEPNFPLSLWRIDWVSSDRLLIPSDGNSVQPTGREYATRVRPR